MYDKPSALSSSSSSSLVAYIRGSSTSGGDRLARFAADETPAGEGRVVSDRHGCLPETPLALLGHKIGFHGQW